MRERSRFAGGDQAYLRDEQYADASRLSARTRLHQRYGTAEVPWFAWVREQLGLEPGSEVLEVGCGAGVLWAEAGSAALPAGVRLTLTDLSPGMLVEAVERVTAAGLTVAHSETASVGELPFEDDSFDLVVANHMLYHSPDPASAVAELARVLRPGERLIAATNGRAHLQELGEIRHEVFGVDPRHDTTRAFGVESGGALLDAVFDDVEWRAYPDSLRCTDPADVIAFLVSLPPGEGATDHELQAMEDTVARRFEADEWGGPGVFVISKESGLFVCR